MVVYEAEHVVSSGCLLGESPLWDDHSQSLYWLDVNGQQLLHYTPQLDVFGHVPLSHKLGCIAMRAHGGAVAAGQYGFQLLNLTTGALVPICDPEAHLSYARFNDGKCDSSGRFISGTITSDLSRDGGLYSLQPSGEWKQLLDQVSCSNGLVWSPCGTILYYIDSMNYEVCAFDYQLEDGSISNRRTVIKIKEPGIILDGMTIDQEGMLWIAEWGGFGVSRWNPGTGEQLARVEVPVKLVTSCTFAGNGSDILYITTARMGPGETMEQGSPAGDLFRVHTGVAGCGTHSFKG